MAIKELQTRIALKYDTYANWADETKEGLGANLVLLKGEIGICEIPAPEEGETGHEASRVAPTVLFKVGNGEDTFKVLPWASAKAADVYAWAKKSETEFKEWLDKTAKFATDAEVEAIRAALDAKIAAVETAIGATGETGKAIKAIEDRLDVIEDEETGVAATAKAYTDEVIGTQANGEAAATGIRLEIATAEANAIAEAEAKVAVERQRITTLEAADAAQDTKIQENADAIAAEVDRATAAEALINEKFGAAYDKDNTVSEAIAAAKQEVSDAVTTLTGQVNTNIAAIATHDAAIAENKSNIETETSNREAADAILEGKIAEVAGKLSNVANVMDFVGAREVSVDAETKVITVTPVEDETFNKGDVVVDGSGKEYVYDGETWHEFGYADSNTAAIEGLKTRVTTNEGDITGLKAADAAFNTTITTLQGYVDEVASKAQQGIDDAKAADDKAVAAQNTADDVKAAVEHTTTGLAATKVIADRADAKAAENSGRIDAAVANITTLQGIVETGADSNANLRSDITNLQALTGGFAEGETKGAIKTAIEQAQKTADDAAAAIVALSTEVTNNKNAIESRVAAIEGDYVKASDLVNDYYIFNCGSSTAVTHEAPKA